MQPSYVPSHLAGILCEWHRMTGYDLREARRASGLSRRALAQLSGLHTDTVRYWEQKPHLDMRGHAPVRMLQALGLGHLSFRESYPVSPSSASSFGVFSPIPRARGGVLGETGFCGPYKRCGARTRKGTPCRARTMHGKARCKFHGGASTGPRTSEGRARIAEAQRKRWVTWRLAEGQRKR